MEIRNKTVEISMAQNYLDNKESHGLCGEEIFSQLVEDCSHEHQEDGGTLFFFSDDSAILMDDNYEYESFQMTTEDEGE